MNTVSSEPHPICRSLQASIHYSQHPFLTPRLILRIDLTLLEQTFPLQPLPISLVPLLPEILLRHGQRIIPLPIIHKPIKHEQILLAQAVPETLLGLEVLECRTPGFGDVLEVIHVGVRGEVGGDDEREVEGVCDVAGVFAGFFVGDGRVKGLGVELVEGPEVHLRFVGGFDGFVLRDGGRRVEVSSDCWFA